MRLYYQIVSFLSKFHGNITSMCVSTAGEEDHHGISLEPYCMPDDDFTSHCFWIIGDPCRIELELSNDAKVHIRLIDDDMLKIKVTNYYCDNCKNEIHIPSNAIEKFFCFFENLINLPSQTCNMLSSGLEILLKLLDKDAWAFREAEYTRSSSSGSLVCYNSNNHSIEEVFSSALCNMNTLECVKLTLNNGALLIIHKVDKNIDVLPTSVAMARLAKLGMDNLKIMVI